MHDLGEIEMWRERREGLAREVEEGRLARRLRSSHRKDGHRSALAGRVMGWARDAARPPLAKGT